MPSPDPASAHRAAFSLALKNPDHTAASLFAPSRPGILRHVSVLAGLAGLGAPELLLGLLSIAGLAFFVCALCFRIWLYIGGCGAVTQRAAVRAQGNWPVYTLLIALKDEAASAAQLSAAIGALDYPAGCLDVKLLIETGDHETECALHSQRWPAGTELLVVPPGLPRTKPRALNYGLARARGEFVVVYDAEDRPHPDQLKSAVRTFRAAEDDLACVQAPLIGEGARGWIAGQWALEYAVQFGRLLPGLAVAGLPVALGGTSNHFRRSALDASGGWDAWNVTEDADLGLRLARLGYRVGMIAPPTLEAPPETIGVWLAQRSRWLKGFLQTWLVAMRRPGRALRELGIFRFLSIQLTLGAAILSALVHGPWALWLLACLLLPDATLLPVFIWLAGGAYAAGILMALFAPGARGWRRLVLALTQPLYWPLQSLAMLRAVYGLIRQPHYWAKTPHGRIYSPAARVVSIP
ncbi:MAG: glycosyltransferase family 2 protein [Hyphomonas sp.]